VSGFVPTAFMFLFADVKCSFFLLLLDVLLKKSKAVKSNGWARWIAESAGYLTKIT
jgi:hypothetical protein